MAQELSPERERFIEEAFVFMRAIYGEYGEEKGEEMWDTIVTTLDPSVKRHMMLRMITGSCNGNKINLRGWRGKPKKVNVIKAVRSVTGFGLKEAKDIVDLMMGYTGDVDSYNHGQYYYSDTPQTITVRAESRADSIRELEAAGCIV